jgi:uncharacterized protein
VPTLSPVSDLITTPFLEKIYSCYTLNWKGTHGFPHWCRVRENGLRIAALNGANQKVVEYFAFCHDSRRQNEDHDPGHGRRASEFIRSDLFLLMYLSQAEIELLCLACNLHTDGFMDGDITVRTCWDADRLDLMRVGIMPAKKYLCTEAARQDDVFDWAVKRSTDWRISRDQ